MAIRGVRLGNIVYSNLFDAATAATDVNVINTVTVTNAIMEALAASLTNLIVTEDGVDKLRVKEDGATLTFSEIKQVEMMNRQLIELKRLIKHVEEWTEEVVEDQEIEGVRK